MITGNISNAERYFSVNKNFEKAFTFLKTLTPSSAGVFEFDGFKVIISEPETSCTPEKETTFEAHKKYLDIHYVIEGSEIIGYADINFLTPTTQYFEDDDYLLLRPQDFCIVFPEDGHIPAIGNGKYLKKAVVKILV